MKDVTITVVKGEEGGYRVIVNDDTVTAENAEGSKGNDSFFVVDSRGDVEKKVAEILKNLE
ncbi:MAG: hypothetical protein AAAB35_06590 [Phyllobacterium sp.]|uniref:hypothetical protein n=1 Tax=Phyllobacterium sp. TaxID=1871046 RepID=UPI0030F1A2C0